MARRYIDNEIQKILKEKKAHTRHSDTETLIYWLCILIPVVFFCISVPIESQLKDYNFPTSVSLVQGKWWTCKHCRNSIWCSQCDWKGDYHCPVCGTRSGEE